MREDALELLACPRTGSPLELRDAIRAGGEIVSGRLIGREGDSYPIRDGVPRFAGAQGAQSAESVESFGFEWNELNFDAFFLNWREHVVSRNFGSLDYFKGKTILECGSGSGMHARWMLEAGARRVISLELSGTVDGIMRRNLAGFGDRSVIVQADIARPPVRPGVADLVYCINVVQHTADPGATTGSLYRLLGPRSELFINFYLRADRMPRSWHLRQALRERAFSRLPKRATLGFFRATAALSLVPGLDGLLCRYLLIRGEVPDGPRYLWRKYRQTLLNSYDYYGSHHFQHYYTPAQLRRLFEGQGIPLEKVPNFKRVATEDLAGQAFRFVP